MTFAIDDDPHHHPGGTPRGLRRWTCRPAFEEKANLVITLEPAFFGRRLLYRGLTS